MAGKYGSASVWFLVDGYRLTAMKLQGLRFNDIAVQEKDDGLGDGWEEHRPTGTRRIELTQTGGFYDTAARSGHEALASSLPGSPQASVRIACLGFAGMTVGQPFIGAQGIFTADYDVVSENEKLTKANAAHSVTGSAEHGEILEALTDRDGDWVGDTVDSGAASSNGGVGYLQMADGFGAFVGVIQHSTDGNNWDALLTFDSLQAPGGQRKTVTGAVRRYLRLVGTVWGDVSPSASVSPSSSLSPSVSASSSASASLSPSTSASGSASASISPSASVSPSASLSPSVSASASASPSVEAGAAGSATVFCGFCRS